MNQLSEDKIKNIINDFVKVFPDDRLMMTDAYLEDCERLKEKGIHDNECPVCHSSIRIDALTNVFHKGYKVTTKAKTENIGWDYKKNPERDHYTEAEILVLLPAIERADMYLKIVAREETYSSHDRDSKEATKWLKKVKQFEQSLKEKIADKDYLHIDSNELLKALEVYRSKCESIESDKKKPLTNEKVRYDFLYNAVERLNSIMGYETLTEHTGGPTRQTRDMVNGILENYFSMPPFSRNVVVDEPFKHDADGNITNFGVLDKKNFYMTVLSHKGHYFTLHLSRKLM